MVLLVPNENRGLHTAALDVFKQKFQNSANKKLEYQHPAAKKLTPEFVVVGAAAGLSAAVTCLTQVSTVSFGPRAEPWSPQQGQAATRVVLHHTPASLGLSPTPPLAA